MVLAGKPLLLSCAARAQDEGGDKTMAIKTGEKIPSVTLRYMADDGIKEITTDELFGGKKVALFAVPK